MNATSCLSKKLCYQVCRPLSWVFYPAWRRAWRSTTGMQIVSYPNHIIYWSLQIRLLLFCRTDALLVKLSLLVGQSVFYGALWGSVLVCPMVRLPASLFIVTHFDRMAMGQEQKFMLGNDHKLAVSICELLTKHKHILIFQTIEKVHWKSALLSILQYVQDILKE